MSHLGLSDTLPTIPILPAVEKTRKRVLGFPLNNKQDVQEQKLHTTRRTLALSLASISLVNLPSNNLTLAAGKNAFWYKDFLPVDGVKNKIVNEKTGMRSFVSNGVYIANLDTENRVFRLRETALDLMAMEDLIGPSKLNYMRRYLKLKSTFMYFDFDKVISAVPEDQKQSLTTLANKLFDSFEELLDATKERDFPKTKSRYKDTKVILEEVMARDIRGSIDQRAAKQKGQAPSLPENNIKLHTEPLPK